MERTVNSNTYSGHTRTAIVTEVTTRSEDLGTLGGLMYNLSNVEYRIEDFENKGTTETDEYRSLIAERASLKEKIATMQEYLAGYDADDEETED